MTTAEGEKVDMHTIMIDSGLELSFPKPPRRWRAIADIRDRSLQISHHRPHE